MAEVRIKLRNDTAAEWTLRNPVLSLGEPGIENDTGRIKFGDGVTAWVSLDYATLPATGVNISWGEISGILSDQTDLQAELSRIESDALALAIALS